MGNVTRKPLAGPADSSSPDGIKTSGTVPVARSVAESPAHSGFVDAERTDPMANPEPIRPLSAWPSADELGSSFSRIDPVLSPPKPALFGELAELFRHEFPSSPGAAALAESGEFKAGGGLGCPRDVGESGEGARSDTIPAPPPAPEDFEPGH